MRLKKIYATIVAGFPVLFLFWISLIIIIIHKKDTGFEKNWIIFFMWFATFLSSVLLVLYSLPKTLYIKIFTAFKKEWPILLFLLLLALASHFFLLKEYPYVKIGDELRDAGLNGLKIKQGVIRDFFGFGSYSGYGNFAPLIGYLFSFVFGISPYMYLVPAALVGTLSVMTTYVCMRIGFDKKRSFIAALFLLSLPLHLNYSRSELVVISDSLLSILILIATVYASNNTRGFFLLGLLYGVALNFYAGVRGIIVISFLYLFLHYIVICIQNIEKQQIMSIIKRSILHVIICLTLLGIGTIIGAGPKLNNLTNDNMSGTVNGQLISKDPVFFKKKISDKFTFIKTTFTKAFLIYFSEETNSRFQNKGPFIPFPLNWLFLVGFFYLLTSKKDRHNNLHSILLIAAFLFPFTNEVLINAVGVDHRLMSIAPVTSAITAIGFVTLIERFFGNRRIVASYMMHMACIFLLLIQFLFFFYQRPGNAENYTEGVHKYVKQRIADYIHADTSSTTYYIVNNDPYEFLAHDKEKMDFYGYPKTVHVLDKELFKAQITHRNNNVAEKYIFFEKKDIPDPQLAVEITTVCSPNTLINYRCPKKFVGSYHFFVL